MTTPDYTIGQPVHIIGGGEVYIITECIEDMHGKYRYRMIHPDLVDGLMVPETVLIQWRDTDQMNKTINYLVAL